MKKISAIFPAIIIGLIFFTAADGSVKKDLSLKLRSGAHPSYLRIVFEGPPSVTKQGRASIKGENLHVSFGDQTYKILNFSKIDFKRKDLKIIIPLKKYSRIRAFHLRGPARFVIDMKGDNKKKAVSRKKKANRNLKEKAAEKAKKVEPGELKEKQVKTAENIEPGTEIDLKKEEKKNRGRLEEDLLIPYSYRKIWDNFKAGHSIDAMRTLDSHRGIKESPAVHHYIYARALEKMSDDINALDRYRLAYIYATDDLRELALLRRSKLYFQSRLYHEAITSYSTFIKEFPDSGDIRNAHLNIARSLERTGAYSNSVDHYKKSGGTPDAMFGLANALQKQGRIKEARKAYKKAILADNSYIKTSDESKYYLSENLRMTGHLKEARKYLMTIKFGRYKDHADISLGLIAMAEAKYETANIKYRSASGSPDKKVVARALYHQAFALEKKGDVGGAISNFTKIRHEHYNSNLYRPAILELARLHRMNNEVKKAIPLLKELVYGKQPPATAFKELELIMVESIEKTGDSDSDSKLSKLWHEIGQWLLDEKREIFLMSVADKFKNKEGKIYLKISSWIVENGSNKGRKVAAESLADYFVEMGNPDVARKYLKIAAGSNKLNDDLLKIESKILKAEGKYDRALNNIITVKKLGDEGIEILAGIMDGLIINGSAGLNKSIDFYEKKLKEREWDVRHYVRLADTLHQLGRYKKALTYYQIALKKKPDDEWVAYRVGRAIGRPESTDLFAWLEKGDSLVSQVAKTKMIEYSLLDKVNEVY